METKHTTDTLELRSLYQDHKAHLISLTLGEELDGTRKGVMRRDRNLCTVNAWGDPVLMTKMFFPGVDVQVTRMRTLDPSGHHRVMHRVTGAGFAPGELNLIEYPEAHLWYLVEHHKDDVYVVPLFPAELLMASSAGIVATRYGVAIRAVIQHGDVEEMRAEAERVRAALADPEGVRRGSAGGEPAHVDEVRAALAELDAALAKVES